MTLFTVIFVISEVSMLPMVNKQPQGRVLVVDDNAEAAEMLQMLLNLEGYDTEIALNGEQGLAITASFMPHVVCSDLNMPRMSGLELAREIRSSSHSHHVFLIAITGRGEPNLPLDVSSAGFDAFFIKPVAFENFSELVRNFFRNNPPME